MQFAELLRPDLLRAFLWPLPSSCLPSERLRGGDGADRRKGKEEEGEASVSTGVRLKREAPTLPILSRGLRTKTQSRRRRKEDRPDEWRRERSSEAGGKRKG